MHWSNTSSVQTDYCMEQPFWQRAVYFFVLWRLSVYLRSTYTGQANVWCPKPSIIVDKEVLYKQVKIECSSGVKIYIEHKHAGCKALMYRETCCLSVFSKDRTSACTCIGAATQEVILILDMLGKHISLSMWYRYSRWQSEPITSGHPGAWACYLMFGR